MGEFGWKEVLKQFLGEERATPDFRRLEWRPLRGVRAKENEDAFC